MRQVKLRAYKREGSGKKVARKLRAQGLVPGVAYGLGKEPVVLSVPDNELRNVLRTAQGLNVLIDLEIEGVPTEEDVAVLIKDIQRNPITRQALSVDLQWVSLTEPVTVEVPIQVEGEAPGVEAGGTLEQLLHRIEVSCVPTAIPEQLVVDVSGMQINDTLHVSDLVVPEGVEVLAHPEDPVVTVWPPVTIEEVESRLEGEELEGEELEAEEEAEEGEEAEAE